jgi:hypothetical protein
MRFAVSFERREGADVMNAPLFVERRHRLSSSQKYLKFSDQAIWLSLSVG